MPQQLAFDLPPQVAWGPNDFFVSLANAQAYAMVTNPAGWPEGKLALIGPKGSGKSHLSRVFRHFTDAQVFEAADLPTDLPRTAVVVENVDQLPNAAEETLFHLHNHLRAARLPLLLTSTKPPIQWDIALPDLASRMQAAPTAQIDDPDDRLLMAVLMKHFSDRQLTPKPQLISYIANHIERSFSAAADIVAKLDAHALRTGEKINTTLAKQYLPFHGH